MSGLRRSCTGSPSQHARVRALLLQLQHSDCRSLQCVYMWCRGVHMAHDASMAALACLGCSGPWVHVKPLRRLVNSKHWYRKCLTNITMCCRVVRRNVLPRTRQVKRRLPEHQHPRQLTSGQTSRHRQHGSALCPSEPQQTLGSSLASSGHDSGSPC